MQHLSRAPEERGTQGEVMYRQMAHRVQFTMSVPATVRNEGKWYYSSCPVLDVHSQGRTDKEAIDNLVEALQLFVETCFEQGTLGQVLREQGFEPARDGDEQPAGRMVEVPLALIARQNAETHVY